MIVFISNILTILYAMPVDFVSDNTHRNITTISYEII